MTCGTALSLNDLLRADGACRKRSLQRQTGPPCMAPRQSTAMTACGFSISLRTFATRTDEHDHDADRSSDAASVPE